MVFLRYVIFAHGLCPIATLDYKPEQAIVIDIQAVAVCVLYWMIAMPVGKGFTEMLTTFSPFPLVLNVRIGGTEERHCSVCDTK